jgi:hypothetical protein
MLADFARTSPDASGRLTRVGAWLLTILAAVGPLVFGAGTAPAHTPPSAGNRVRDSAPETITAVGVSEHISPAQGRGPPLSRPRFVVATGVAASSARVFTSTDDHVADAANAIEAARPGCRGAGVQGCTTWSR